MRYVRLSYGFVFKPVWVSDYYGDEEHRSRLAEHARQTDPEFQRMEERKAALTDFIHECEIWAEQAKHAAAEDRAVAAELRQALADIKDAKRELRAVSSSLELSIYG